MLVTTRKCRDGLKRYFETKKREIECCVVKDGDFSLETTKETNVAQDVSK
jgi:hypothetical protein